MMSLSKLTSNFPWPGCRTMSVARKPALLFSTPFIHAWCHIVSYVMSACATRLYILTMRFAPGANMMSSFLANARMGSSIRRSSCRAHMMSPATGGAFRAFGGLCFCFSYVFWTASKSAP